MPFREWPLSRCEISDDELGLRDFAEKPPSVYAAVEALRSVNNAGL